MTPVVVSSVLGLTAHTLDQHNGVTHRRTEYLVAGLLDFVKTVNGWRKVRGHFVKYST